MRETHKFVVHLSTCPPCFNIHCNKYSDTIMKKTFINRSLIAALKAHEQNRCGASLGNSAAALYLHHTTLSGNIIPIQTATSEQATSTQYSPLAVMSLILRGSIE